MAMRRSGAGQVSIRRLLDFVIRESKHTEMKMILLGRPGAGKGTYGSRLSKFLNAPHISTGDLIREELRKRSPISEFISETISKGKLLGDETVVELLLKRLQSGQSRGDSRGFILDGFPRTLKQAEILDRVTSVDVVVNFNLEEEALVEKCLGRRMCGECGQIFSLSDVAVGEARMPAMPPPIECMSKMVIRKDDNLESIRRRLEVYNAESKPVEEYYREQNKLVNFDVCGSVEENWPRLLESLNLEKGSSNSSKRFRSGFVRSSSCSRQATAAGLR